jgi:hypothetical protein
MGTTEIWKDILGFEGLYEVSNLGRVKSLCKKLNTEIRHNKTRISKEILLKPYLSYSGHPQVTLTHNYTHKVKRICILMITAFVQNNENKPFVIHKDGDRKNNIIENLEWSCVNETNNPYIDIKTKKDLGIELKFDKITLTGDESKLIKYSNLRIGNTQHYYNYAGHRFGMLIPILYVKRITNGHVRYKWMCKCDCGNITYATTSGLINGEIVSCGCKKYKDCFSAYKETLRNGRTKYQMFIDKLCRIYITQSTQRKLKFELTHTDVEELTQGNCAYCGSIPNTKLVSSKSGRTKETFYYDFTYNGIDRVDNIVGYIKTNCVSCCITCNRMKTSMNVNDFYEHISKIYHKSLLHEKHCING